MTVSHPEILTKVMQVGLEAEKRQEARLVEALITSAAKGNGAVVGLENTLAAINDKRVQSLFVAQGYRKAGYRCQNSDYITFHIMERCPVCEGKIEPAEDIVEMAISTVMRHGGNIEIVHDNAQLDKVGEIGALLRY
jgi:peptide subunit release factor 1 (eRF1)